MKRTFYRHGDVLVERVPSVPVNVKPIPAENGRSVLAHGEVTGHHHSFAMGERVALFREDGSGGGMFLAVTGAAPAALEHQEHTTIPVPPGDYRVAIQVTYTRGAIRRVED